jgi:hypothetical protein
MTGLMLAKRVQDERLKSTAQEVNVGVFHGWALWTASNLCRPKFETTQEDVVRSLRLSDAGFRLLRPVNSAAFDVEIRDRPSLGI